MNDLLTKFLNTSNILCPLQSGFHQKHSTLSTLVHVFNIWNDALDNGFVIGVVFLDLSKTLIP